MAHKDMALLHHRNLIALGSCRANATVSVEQASKTNLVSTGDLCCVEPPTPSTRVPLGHVGDSSGSASSTPAPSHPPPLYLHPHPLTPPSPGASEEVFYSFPQATSGPQDLAPLNTDVPVMHMVDLIGRVAIFKFKSTDCT